MRRQSDIAASLGMAWGEAKGETDWRRQLAMNLNPAKVDRMDSILEGDPKALFARIYAMQLSRSRGHADYWTGASKEEKELLIVADFLRVEFPNLPNYGLRSLKSFNPDPPDCVAEALDGCLIAFELTELVDEPSIDSSKKGRPRRRNWEEPDLMHSLAMRIGEKDTKIAKNYKKIAETQSTTLVGRSIGRTILLIHSDEPDLQDGRFEKALRTREFGKTEVINEAYLLLSYMPEINCRPIRLNLESPP